MAGGSSGQGGWAVAGLGPGSLVAGYRVEARIGAGGMAIVLRARDEALGRAVALKILPPALAGDAEFRERFVRESRAVAAVDHPHIIPVYAAGEANGVLYLAMRYVVGGDLRSVGRREGPLPGERAVALLSPVASALDAAHAAGLVHRDVKPANILIDTSPGRPEHPYLSDFGLARGSSSSTGLTGTGQYLGTPDYSAPEQISGKQTGPRTDQYALACVAYTILTGSLPFARDESMAVLWAHVYDPPPSLTAARPDLPAATDQVLARALAKTPEDRYRTCGEFIDTLRAALSEAPRGGRSTGFADSGSTAGGTADLSLPQRAAREPAERVPTGPLLHQPPWSLAESLPVPPVNPSVPPVSAATRSTPARAPDRETGQGGRRWPVITGALVLLVLLLSGGFYGFWRYNQGQYYLGVSADGNVAIFRGTSQSLAGISLSSLLTESTLKASMLTSGDQAALQQTISTGSLTGAQQRIDQLQAEATQCQTTYQNLAAWQAQDLAYAQYVAAKALAAKNHAKPPAAVASPGAMPTQLPNADQCAPSAAFGIAASALPDPGAPGAPGESTPSPSPRALPLP